MADFLSQIPKLNNIQFVPEGWELPSQYHFTPDDKDWYFDNIKDWQFSRPYKQKIQHNDKQYLVVKRTGFNDVYFKIYNCNQEAQILRPSETGDAKYRMPADFVIEDSGDVYVKEDGTEVPLIYHQWQFRFSDFNLPDGEYYMYVPIEYFDGVTLVETRAWISEPIQLQDDYPDTVLIQYYNNTNTDDVIFKYDMSDGTGFSGSFYFKPKFGLRVEGCLKAPQVASNDIGYKEQDYEQRLLNSFRWNDKQLYIGDDNGVPFYIIDKLNQILGCDEVFIEGRRYVKDEGAEWQLNEADIYPLYAGSIKVRDYDKRDEITDLRGQTVLFAELDGTYPAAIHQTALNVAPGIVLENDTERDDFVDDLNNFILEAFGYTGVASVDTGGIYYTAAVGESLSLFTPKTLYNHTDFTCVIGTANQNMTFDFVDFYGVIDWDDMFYISGAGFDEKYQQPFSISGNETRRHIFPNTGTYTVRIFHEDAVIGELSIGNGTGSTQFSCSVTGITGNIPQGLTSLFIRGANLGSFSLDFIASARTNLQSLTVRNSGITGFTTNVFADYSKIGIGGSSANWSQLTYVSIFQNGLSLLEQEAFIDDFYVHALPSTAGSLITRQSPANTVSNATTLSYLSAMNSAGWFTLS